MNDDRPAVVELAAVIGLTVVLLAAVVGITIVAVTTNRDLWRAEALTFAGVAVLGTLGGATIWRRRRRWRVNVEHEGNGNGASR